MNYSSRTTLQTPLARSHASLAVMASLVGVAGWLVVGASAEPEAAPTSKTRRAIQGIPPYSPPGASPTIAPTSQVTPPLAPPPGPMAPPAGPPLPDDMLSWDGEEKESTVTLGDTDASFAFLVRNLSKEPITIISVGTSCGCTVAKLAETPWIIAPGARGSIEVVMNLAGKQGIVEKVVTVNTDQGHKILKVRTVIQEPPAGTMSQADRVKNLRIATENRQAVLHGDCASCHATPARGKMGVELYQAACTICHEAEHRAANVPDLGNLRKDTDADYWRGWIASSAEGTLMPAFSVDEGGILNSAQIESLVSYLVEIRSSGKKQDEAPAPAGSTSP